jgi:hypothetical protein
MIKQAGAVKEVIYLFLVYLTTLSVSEYMASNERLIVNNELEMMWKEAVVAFFKLLSWNLPGGTEVNHENLS